MYITVAGGGRIGRGLAKRLVEDKHDVVVIDREKAVCEAIYAEYGALTVQGNATDLSVLEQAGIEKSDIAVAAMRNDSANLTFALLAKHFDVKDVHVRMNSPEYEGIYRSIGVTNIARVTELLIEQFLVKIETPDIRKAIGFGDLEIDIINVPEGSPVAGLKVGDLPSLKRFPEDVVLTCIFHDASEQFEVPKTETQIHVHDRLFLCGTRKNILTAAKAIRK